MNQIARNVSPVGGALGGGLRVYATLREDIESQFLGAGQNLGKALDDLNTLGEKFSDLQIAIGPEAEEALKTSIDLVNRHLDGLNADCDNFADASDSLRRSIRDIATEVHELDRVVRTIANISINARIQGNSLVPPRAQVTAFIDRLASMSEESEAILQEINDSMASVGFDVSAMDYEQNEMLSELKYNVIPAIAGFTAMSKRLQSNQASVVAASNALSEQTKDIKSEVSRIVMALQIGDSARQRIERIEDTLEYAAKAPDNQRWGYIDVAMALSEGMADTALGEATTAIGSLDQVSNMANDAIRSSGTSVFAQANDHTTKQNAEHHDKLAQSLSGNGQHFSALKDRAAGVHERLSAILRHEAKLRRIAHEIRLSGINAVIICAKLGPDGRALRELAHWLRDLTDESDAIIQRLQGILAETRETIRVLTEDRLGGMETGLEIFSTDAKQLDDIIKGIMGAIENTRVAFETTANALPDQLGSATTQLRRFEKRLKALGRETDPLGLHRKQLPKVELNMRSLSDLETLRKRYTMSSEREIHDGLISAFTGQKVERDDAAPVADPTMASGTNIDDILF